MARSRLVGLALVGALGLTGCNETSGGGAGPVASAPSPTRADYAPPPGGKVSCAAEIDRFQAIVSSDRDTGNVDQKVYEQIEAELSRASAACAAGRNGDAHALLAASKSRHGYRA